MNLRQFCQKPKGAETKVDHNVFAENYREALFFERERIIPAVQGLVVQGFLWTKKDNVVWKAHNFGECCREIDYNFYIADETWLDL